MCSVCNDVPNDTASVQGCSVFLKCAIIAYSLQQSLLIYKTPCCMHFLERICELLYGTHFIPILSTLQEHVFAHVQFCFLFCFSFFLILNIHSKNPRNASMMMLSCSCFVFVARGCRSYLSDCFLFTSFLFYN